VARNASAQGHRIASSGQSRHGAMDRCRRLKSYACTAQKKTRVRLST
jgi:hypothetical protein